MTYLAVPAHHYEFAVAADTPIFAAGGATPAMSMAGSCSVSGVTPGSIMSTASAAADAAQCSVRGTFVARGMRAHC